MLIATWSLGRVRPMCRDGRPVHVEAATGDARELATADELRALLVAHGLAGLRWTNEVIIRRGTIPHSHPTLTLNTASTGDVLLSSYIHEQLHWWLDANPGTDHAIAATGRLWATVPSTADGGARDEYSTRLHLVLCHLERRALTEVVGADRADSVVEQQIARGIYPWIRHVILQCDAQLEEITEASGLWPPQKLR